jgi:hypothetical protein
MTWLRHFLINDAIQIKPPQGLGTNDRGSGRMGESALQMRGGCKGDAAALQGA